MFSERRRADQREDLAGDASRCAGPATSSSSVSVPASKNFSISFSSASATISMSASRARVDGGGHVGGHRAFGELAAARRSGTMNAFSRHEIDDAA